MDNCKGFFDNNYYDIKKGENSDAWRYGLFTANGEMGIIESMSPDNDVIIYNNTKCVQDIVEPMETADISVYMDEIKKRVLSRDEPGCWTEFVKGYWEERYGMKNHISCGSRPYFPAAQLRIENAAGHSGYERYVDFNTGEIGCVFTDSQDRHVTKRSFVSRESGYAVTFLKSELEKDLRISFDDPKDMGMDGCVTPCIKFPDIQLVTECGRKVRMGVIGKTPVSHIGDNADNPETELAHSGYAVTLRLLSDGVCKRDEKYIYVYGAKKVMLIAHVDYRRSGFDSIDDVRSGLYDRMQAQLDDYIEKNSVRACETSYATMLELHAAIHGRLFGSVSLDLCGDDADITAVSSSELHRIQQRGGDCEGEYGINKLWLNLLYENSRFATICSHGYSTARLGGIWIGNWLASWGGDHTLNANTNAQISGLNTGNLPELTESYINFMLDHAAD